MRYEQIIYTKANGKAVITLNRPERLNAYTVKMEEELADAIADFEADDSVKVVTVTGAGRGFCPGHDLDEAKILNAQSTNSAGFEIRFDNDHYPPAVFWKISKPAIAAINGVVAGGALAICLACDIRIASEKAVFYENHVARVGTTPGLESLLLPNLLGLQRALELAFTGRPLDAQEAYKLGLVIQVVPPDKLMEAADALATQIAKSPLGALRLAKKAIYKGLGMPEEDTLSYVTLARRLCSESGVNLNRPH